nr:MAG: RNA-dependent RNA polymerase [Drosophila Inveresk nyamivirus]
MSSDNDRFYRSDRHLASPLCNSEINHMYSAHLKGNNRNLSSVQKAILSKLGTEQPCWIKYGRKHHAAVCLFKQIWNATKSEDCEASKCMLIEDLKISQECLQLSRNYVYDIIQAGQIDTKLKNIINIGSQNVILKYYHIKQSIRNFLEKSKSKSTLITYKIGSNFEIEFFGNLLYYTCDSGKHIETWSTFTSVCDMIFGHFNVLLYSLLLDYFDMRPVLIYPVVVNFLSEMIEIVLRHGNDAFDFFKAFPSISIGANLVRNEPESGEIFNPSVIESFSPIFLSSYCYKVLVEYGKIPEYFSVSMELSGLWKSASHPYVDMDKGVEKIITRGNTDPIINQLNADHIVYNFRFNFVKSYWSKHNKWPGHHVLSDAPEILKRCSKAGKWDGRNLSPWMFKYMFFDKTFEFNYHVDMLDLLSDKSICADIDQLTREINTQAHWNKYGHGVRHIGTQRSKRLLVEVLQMKEISIRSIINHLEIYKRFPKCDRVIVLVAKERELKVEPRFFCKSSLTARLWQVATEMNVSDQILPYCPFQTMTSSLQNLLLRLNRLSKSLDMNAGEIEYVAVTIDFSSWNLRFRHETVHLLMRDLDCLFGLKDIYYYTQIFPQECEILVQDVFDPPEQGRNGRFIPGNRKFDGFKSWFEGMRQKVWTIYTANLLLYVARENKYHISVTGQGDNQVVLVKILPYHLLFEKGMSPYDYVNFYLKRLNEICETINLPIKIEESWMSCHLIEYSRQYFYKGVQIPSALKKVSRMHATANSDLPTTAGDISSISASGSSVADVDKAPDPAYLCAIMENCQTMRSSWPTLWKELSYREKIQWMFTPRVAGGLPITQYHEYVVRGVQDPLTHYYSFMKYLWNRVPEQKTAIQALRLRIDSNFNYLLLIKDPLSLPIKSPLQPENVLKNTVKDYLITSVTNENIKQMMALSNPETEQEMVNTLLSIRPLNTRICNQIFSFSNLALIEKIIGRFSSTQSISNLAVRKQPLIRDVFDIEYMSLYDLLDDYVNITGSGTLDTISRMILTDKKCETWYLDKIFKDRRITFDNYLSVMSDEYLNHNNCLSDCSFIMAETMRKVSWKLPIEYVTQPCFFDQGFIVQFKDVNKDQLRKSVYIRVLAGTGRLDTAGSVHPYLGNETKEKEKQPLLQTIQVHDMMRTIKSIISKFDWFSDPNDVNIQELKQILLEEKTHVNVNTLQQISGTIYGGRPEHRLRNPMARPGASHCGLINFPTHVQFSSNSAVEYSQSADDYTIMFQMIYLTATSLLSGLELLKKLPCVENEWSYVISCDDCTKRIPDQKYQLSEPSKYRGYQVPQRIDQIDILPMIRHSASENIDPRVAYAVYLGHKIVSSMRTYDRSEVIAYEHTISNDQDQGSNKINLTELRALDLKTLINTITNLMGRLTNYPIIKKDPDSITNQKEQFEEDEEDENMFIDEIRNPAWENSNLVHQILNIIELSPFKTFGMLDNLSRALIQTRRVHHLYQLYNFLPKVYSASLTVQSLSQMLIILFNKLRCDETEQLRLTGKMVPNDCSKRIFSMVWIHQIFPIRKSLSEKFYKIKELIYQIVGDNEDLGGIIYPQEINASLLSSLEDTKPIILEEEGKICLQLRDMIRSSKISSVTPHMDAEYSLTFEYPSDLSTPHHYIRINLPDIDINEGITSPIDMKPSNPPFKVGHCYRIIGSISTAPSKYFEIMGQLNVKFTHQICAIISLAEGSGSVSNMFMHLYPSSILFYNSLLPSNEIGMDPSLFCPPACIQDSCFIAPRVAPVLQLNRNGRDLTSFENIKHLYFSILDVMSDTDLEEIPLITMDAERPGNLAKYHELLENVLSFCVSLSKVDTISIIKVFISEPPAQLFIETSRLHFRSVQIHKPLSSENSNSECFIVLRYPVVIYNEFNKVCLKDAISVSCETTLNIFSELRDKRSFDFCLDDLYRHKQVYKKLLEATMETPCLSNWVNDMNTLGLSGSIPISFISDIRNRINEILTSLRVSTRQQVLDVVGYEFTKILIRNHQDDLHDIVLTSLKLYHYLLMLTSLTLNESVSEIHNYQLIEKIECYHVHILINMDSCMELCKSKSCTRYEDTYSQSSGSFKQTVITKYQKRILRILSAIHMMS